MKTLTIDKNTKFDDIRGISGVEAVICIGEVDAEIRAYAQSCIRGVHGATITKLENK